MTLSDPPFIDSVVSDAELESLRKELESMIDRERAALREEQRVSLLRIEELSRNTLVRVASEWKDYEILLASSREELLKRAREEMLRLLSTSSKDEMSDDRIRSLFQALLPTAEHHCAEGKDN